MSQRDKFEDFKHRARSEYIRCDGDIDRVFKALDGEVPRARLRKWESLDDWSSYLVIVREFVANDLKKKEKSRRDQNYELLMFAKQQILTAMTDQIDKQTKRLVKRAVQPKSLEECAKTFLEILKFEQQNFGGAGDHAGEVERTMDLFSKFIRERAQESAHQSEAIEAAAATSSKNDDATTQQEPNADSNNNAGQTGSKTGGATDSQRESARTVQ